MGKTRQGRWCGVAVGVGSTRLDGEAFEELGQNGGVARVPPKAHVCLVANILVVPRQVVPIVQERLHTPSCSMSSLLTISRRLNVEIADNDMTPHVRSSWLVGPSSRRQTEPVCHSGAWAASAIFRRGNLQAATHEWSETSGSASALD